MTDYEFKFRRKVYDYPEGSGGKFMYDLARLSFQEILSKYYQHVDLSRWKYVNEKFVTPLFDISKHYEYQIFLQQAKPSFNPQPNEALRFWSQIKDDKRFDIELKQFFSFLHSINFFRELQFEEWLQVKYWAHPWHKETNEKGRSVLEILSYPYGENYLKEAFGSLSIF